MNFLQPGRTLKHYRIINKIGQGGMGEVYSAEDTTLGRKVALKILPAEVASDHQRMHRFVQEAKAASALNHPNILTIHEVGEDSGINFIATEFIDGETLRQHMRGARLKLSEVLNVAIQTADALAAAHEAGIIHRDIKPENIMLRQRDGYVKVLDFGLAKLIEQRPVAVDTEAPTKALFKTEEGVVMGTVTYMSPEQARGLEVDARTDIFSLGVVLYEMVAGSLPFEGSTASEVLAAILSEKEPPPLARFARDVPAELERIVTKVLRKEREERYQGIKDLRLDLKSLKQRLEFETELERSKPPDLSSAPASALSGRQAMIDTAQEPTAQTGEIAAISTTSSAKHLIGKISQHKRVAVLVLAVLVIAIAAFLLITGTPALTDKDTILLADWTNTTGDAVFDGTLKQALAVQLQQSPFLNIFPEDRVRETLRMMNREPDERVTSAIGREICQRQGLKALVAGSITSLGRNYVITLETINSQTGEAIARQQVEAESKEQVIKKLGEATTKLREKLGESLASIQKFDAPIEQATTSSLEALKDLSVASELGSKGKVLEAIPVLQHAIELDPNFALAYVRLSTMYGNSGQRELSAEYAQKAFELRERVSERERLFISSHYYSNTTREADKAIETLELWKRMYPRDFLPHNNLANQYRRIGQYEKAIEAASEAVRLNPNSVVGYLNLASAFISLNRFEEAKEICERALARKLDATGIHHGFYVIAFVQGDTAAMKQQIDWASGKPEEYAPLGWQAEAATFSAQLRRAHEFFSRATDLAMRRNVKEVATAYASEGLWRDAVFGNCQRIKEDTSKALSIGRSDYSLFNGAIALALCREVGQAQSLADELAKRNPKDTVTNVIWLPVIRAALELQRGHPDQAIQFLQAASPYESAAQFWPNYLRGQAYLRWQKGAEAMAEFQTILDHRGWDTISPFYPLAHLGLARAAVLQGDSAKARKEYQDFFALWKDADADLPILIEAKKEYEKLK